MVEEMKIAKPSLPPYSKLVWHFIILVIAVPAKVLEGLGLRGEHGGHDTKELLEFFNLVATVIVVIS